MKTGRNKYYLLNFIFIGCLILLLINDHYLKPTYANLLTGKLSDIVGIIILPLLLAYSVPQVKNAATPIAAILFIFWKSPFSQPLINVYNTYSFVKTSRIIDYTDLWVLLLLPVPYYIIKNIHQINFIKVKSLHPWMVLAPAVMGLIATSPPPSYYYTRTQGNLHCYQCHFSVNMGQEKIVQKLQQVGIVFDSIAPIDSAIQQRVPGLKDENARTYRLNALIIDNDTLRDLDFTMRSTKENKTKIYFNGMNVPDSLATPELETKLRRYYKKIVFKYLKSELKNH